MGRILRAAVIVVALVAWTATPAAASHPAGLLRGRATIDYAPAYTVKWTDSSHATHHPLRVVSGTGVVATFDLQTTYRIEKVLVDFGSMLCWSSIASLSLRDSANREIKQFFLCDLGDNILKSITPVSGVRYVRLNLSGNPGNEITIYEVEVYGTSDDTTPPATPANLTASAGDGYVDLTWSAVGDADLAGYRVYRSTDGGATWPVSVDVGLGTSYRFSGLTNGVTYTFAVVAYDIARNESPRSQPVSATPRDMTPPAPPSGLLLEPRDGQIRASWSANTEPDLAGYRLYYRPEGEPSWVLAAELPTATRTFTLTGLANGQTYHVGVSAFDARGNESPVTAAAATPRDMTPPPPPAGLSAAPGDEQVALSWPAASDPDVAGYRIYYRPADDSTWTLAAELGATATSHTVTGLTNDVPYEFGLVALDAAGNESPPATTVATPTEIPPNPPAGLSATPGDGQVELAWQASPPPPEVSGYRVYYRVRGAQAWTLAADVGPATLSWTLAGLENGTEYEVAVKGYTTEKESQPATAVVRPQGPDTEPPPSPSPVTAYPGDARVALSWPAVSAPDLAGYRVYLRGPGDPFWTRAASPGASATQYTVGGLVNGQRYEFGVSAYDLAGNESLMATTDATPDVVTLPEALLDLTGNLGGTVRDALGGTASMWVILAALIIAVKVSAWAIGWWSGS